MSDTLWLEVQRRLDDPARKSNRNGTDRKHLGSGLYRCGVCGQRVKVHHTRYRCAGHGGMIDGLMFKEIKLEAEATIDRLEGERLSLSGGSTPSQCSLPTIQCTLSAAPTWQRCGQ